MDVCLCNKSVYVCVRVSKYPWWIGRGGFGPRAISSIEHHPTTTIIIIVVVVFVVAASNARAPGIPSAIGQHGTATMLGYAVCATMRDEQGFKKGMRPGKASRRLAVDAEEEHGAKYIYIAHRT